MAPCVCDRPETRLRAGYLTPPFDAVHRTSIIIAIHCAIDRSMPIDTSRLVVFDFFGVFCSDFVMGWLASRRLEHRAADLIRDHVHPADLGRISFDEQCRRFGHDLGLDWQDVKDGMLSFAHLDHDVVRIAQDVARVAPIALCSNAPQGVVEGVLDRASVALPFGVRVISGDVGLMKPDAAIYRRVLDEAAMPAGRAVFIDDRHVNVAAAEALGIGGIVFTLAAPLAARLRDLGFLA